VSRSLPKRQYFRMKRFFIFLLMSVGLITTGWTQNPTDFVRNAVLDLYAQILVFPQEKIYLQTDRPYYVMGDRIFFRAFLLNASTNRPSEISRYVYVELINSKREIVLRQQIRIDDNYMFYGALSLPETMAQGNYQIRAYTRYMENMGEKSFYTRPVFIADPSAIKTEIGTDTKSLNTQKNNPPSSQQSPEVNFYPEGGNLIAGQPNRIAFKALLPNGRAAEIEGSLYNSNNEKLTDFSTVHEGMGSFTLQPEAGKKYYARYTFQGQSFKSDLPPANNNTCSLQASWENDSLSIRITKPAGMPDEKLYLLIVCGGVPTYLEQWNNREKLVLQKNKFKSGVSHLMLLTSAFQPISERLVFVNQDETKLDVQTDKAAYHTRERVELDIRLPEPANDTIPSSFAVSVLDNRDIQPDTTTNIVAEILLVSELEGRINHPAWYLQTGNEQVNRAADLLMLTHGWRQYHVEDALQHKLQKPKIKPEVSQSFTGVLKKPNGRVYKNAKIKMDALSDEYEYSDVVMSDEQGRYRFDGFELPDSTAYMFLTYTNEKTEDIEIHPDTILYPPVMLTFEDGEVTALKLKEPDFVNYVAKADQQYRYENGQRMIDLPVVTVKANVLYKNKRRYDNEFLPGEPDYWMSADRIKELNMFTFDELFRWVRGVNVEGDYAIVRGKVARFVVNGMPAGSSIEGLSLRIFPWETAQIDVYAIPNMETIALTTYPPGAKEKVPTANKKTLLPLGYQKPVAFYSPKYENPELSNDATPDLRTVIYWNPQGIFDENGNASVEFYTADILSEYSVVIEGVSGDGKLIYYRKAKAIQIKK